MNRRTFISGVTAALPLPITGDGTDDRSVEVTEDEEIGSGRANVKETREAFAALELFEHFDESAELGTNSYWGGGEDPHVEVSVSSDLAAVTMALSPEEARAFATDLQAAACHAEEGARSRTGVESDG